MSLLRKQELAVWECFLSANYCAEPFPGAVSSDKPCGHHQAFLSLAGKSIVSRGAMGAVESEKF